MVYNWRLVCECAYLGAYILRMPKATHMRYISPSYRYTSQM